MQMKIWTAIGFSLGCVATLAMGWFFLLLLFSLTP